MKASELYKLFCLLTLPVILITGCRKDDHNDPAAGAPVISSMVPAMGPKGTLVTLTGSGFGTDTSAVAVFINAKRMLVTTVAPDKIEFIPGPRTGSGLVSLVVNGNAVSGPWFEYIYTVHVTTFSGQPGVSGFANGAATDVRYNKPRGLALDVQGNLYVADEQNHRIRRVSPVGDAITFAGNGIAGHNDGPPLSASFNAPADVEIDEINGHVYVADRLNHCIRRLTLAGDVTTVAGIPGTPGYVDAPGLSARLNEPSGIALEGELVNIYISDAVNHCIRKLDPFEVLTTFAGSNVPGQQDGAGTSAKFNSPNFIDWDSSGFLIVSDPLNQNIRRINKTSLMVSTIGGTGVAGYADGPGALSQFNNPSGVSAVNGTVAICDAQNNRIRLISPSKKVTTLAGDGLAAFLDGAGPWSRFNSPAGIVRTRDGDYFVADSENHCIRKLVVD